MYYTIFHDLNNPVRFTQISPVPVKIRLAAYKAHSPDWCYALKLVKETKHAMYLRVGIALLFCKTQRFYFTGRVIIMLVPRLG